VILKAELNGKPFATEHPPGASLLSTLRLAGIFGPKRGCEAGDCGCCTVWLNGQAVQSCLLPAFRANGQKLTSIEGLAPERGLHPAQQAVLNAEGFQCGYCTAGMIMTLASPGASACSNLQEKLKGNICRCTGWASIARACGVGQAISFASPGAGQVGAAVPNRHGTAIVTGTPAYTADFPEKAMVHLAVLRSPHAHAIIRRIDVSAARAAPGVVAVFTHEDIKRIPFSTACHPAKPRDAYDTYLLDNRVRFVGQRVAVVAAESKHLAQRALSLITVDYQPLPHVVDPVAALEEGAPVIHPEPESFQILNPERNLVGIYERRRGSIDEGFRMADCVIQRTFSTPRQQHTHMEPHVSTAWIDADGTLVVRSSTQVPFLARRTLSRIFEIPEEKIRVFKPLVGGGFGAKQEVQTEDLCALVALQTGRPAHWEMSRTDEFTAATTRHAMRLTVKLGATKEGELTAASLDYISDTGAYGNHAVDVIECAGFEAISILSCPHKYVRGRAVYTNTVPAGAFRGYGASQTTYAVESAMDDLAGELGISPFEFARRNIVRPGGVLAVTDEPASGHQLGSYALHECLAHVEQAFREYSLPANDDEWCYGQGFATACVGGGLPVIHISGARVTLTADGYALSVGTADIGTASDTTLAQIAAQALNARYDQFAVRAGDTRDGTPEDSGAYASATIYIAGRAVQKAAEQLRTRILAFVAQERSCPPERLTLDDSGVTLENGMRLSLAEIFDLAAQLGETLEGLIEKFAHDRVSLSFAVVGLQLRAHLVTGRIELLNCFQAIDAGRLLNPRVCLGQAEGATVQALGFALMEGLEIGANGAVQNPSFRDYRVPAWADLPRIHTKFFEPIDPDGPFGAKAIGELTTNAVPGAVGNAIAHALGARITDLPITAEKVWRLLQSKRSTQSGPFSSPRST
jgi:putative selenate reductase molybdopterin-binding subunit